MDEEDRKQEKKPQITVEHKFKKKTEVTPHKRYERIRIGTMRKTILRKRNYFCQNLQNLNVFFSTFAGYNKECRQN